MSERSGNRLRLGIALLGKGATNRLHKSEVVDKFRDRRVDVTFLVRDDYMELLERLPDCRYVECCFDAQEGGHAKQRGFYRYFRGLYPAKDKGVREFQGQKHKKMPLKQRIVFRMLSFFARYRWIMELSLKIEGRLYDDEDIPGLTATDYDRLLVLGVGVTGTPLEGRLTWWARKHGIPVVHIVGNYDNLSSQGFRGVPIEKILVWGESMRRDAVELQAIEPERVQIIGEIRYDRYQEKITQDRGSFFRSCGLDPERKVILFAGQAPPFHYFEALTVLEELRSEGNDCQMVLRLYPSKNLTRSVYMKPLLDYAARIPGVFVSIADPYYKGGEAGREVLQIEEYELWHLLCYCDVVVNLYSTITVEACLFDKPVVNMWYFSPSDRLTAIPAVYGAFPRLIHNRRIESYGATELATNRRQLKDKILLALSKPGQWKENRARLVVEECGPLDGRVCDRLVDACAQ